MELKKWKEMSRALGSIREMHIGPLVAVIFCWDPQAPGAFSLQCKCQHGMAGIWNHLKWAACNADIMAIRNLRVWSVDD